MNAVTAARERVTPADASVLALIAVVVVSYAFALHIVHVHFAAFADMLARQGLPFAFASANNPATHLGLRIELLFGVMTVVQTAALAALYRMLSSGTPPRFLVPALGIAAAAMFFVSFQTNFTNTDSYYYAYYGNAPSLSASYRTTEPVAFPAGFEGLRSALTSPVAPSVYGPIWQIFDRALVHAARSLQASIEAMRVANAVMLLVIFGSLVAMRVPKSIFALFLLNPALYYDFIVEGHNDIFAIATVALALALLPRTLPGAIALGAVAGLEKVSLILVALATLCTTGTQRTRIVSGVAMVALFLIGSIALGGSAYVHAILTVGSTQGEIETSHLQRIVRLGVQGILAIIVGAAIVAAIGFRRFVPTASYSFAGMSGLIHAWYFSWGLPYALLERRTAALAAIALPLVAYLSNNALIDALHVRFVTFMLIGLIALTIFLLTRRRFSTALL